MTTIYLGIDTGGTFTDFVLWRDGRLRIHKCLSTPEAPERAILQGITELGLQDIALKVIHGSTVATNAVLEGKGVSTVFITNRGFKDLLSIGRQNRAELYDLQPPLSRPPVPPDMCLETGGRVNAQGEQIEPLSAEELAQLARAVSALRPRAVAVNLLFSWKNSIPEEQIAQALPDDVFISLSSQVLPEAREYERGMTTWLNAWVGPLVQGYLRRLQEALPGSAVAVMQSTGETLDARQAGAQAVRMLLSGPAGGLVAARFVGRQAGCQRLLSFDMGGTSTDVALIEGEPALTTEGRLGRYPVAVPMVDMHTIGAGGGSIAWLDAGGMLQVGPESAGARPGPACYGQGGRQPTVTDAHLLLGRLLPERFLGGALSLDVEAARAAMSELARQMGCSVEQAARGVIALVNEQMARALRSISIERGVDPKDFTLVSFGGAGGLHVCALAEALDMRQALVPVHGGVLSALGMLAARPGRQKSRSWLQHWDTVDFSSVRAALDQLARQGLEELEAEGVAAKECSYSYALDLRYLGQSSTLNIPWNDAHKMAADFHAEHARRYGHAMELPLELVNLRVAVHGPQLLLELRPLSSGAAQIPVFHQSVAVYERALLMPEQVVSGPAIITEQVATTWLAAGWQARVDVWGNLLLTRHQA